MPGFSSQDDLISEISQNGKFDNMYFQKTFANAANSAAGRWHETTYLGTGIPAAGTFSGAAGTAVQMNRSTQGALDVGPNVSTDLRSLLGMQLWTPSIVVSPAVALLVDYLLYYPACVVNGAPTTLTNGVGLPRYANGVGVKCMVVTQSANGATQPALTLNYRDQSDNDQAAPFAMTSPGASAPVSTLYANNGAPFLPMAAGDTGIKRINSYTLATGTTGTVAFVLCKFLAAMPIAGSNSPTERDFLSQMVSLPRIEDDACLGIITLIGATMTPAQTLMGVIGHGWG
jgi:hypothetical protein